MLNVARRLLLISLDWTRPKDPPLSLGHASILANLYQNKINVIPRSWAVNHGSFNVTSVLDFIRVHATTSTDVAFGTFIWNEPHIQTILQRLRKDKFSGRIILGGPQISYTKKNLEAFYPHADVFIRGYGEKALTQLMLAKEYSPIFKGIHYANQIDLGLSAEVELNELPSPYLNRIIPPQSFIRWETQRGCPFRCSFCQHRESDISMKRRQFSWNRTIKEAEWILNNPIINDIAVLDPTFNSGSNYLSVLDVLIAGQYKGKIALQCRAEMVNEDFLDTVERLNKTANVVLEFGLQTIHKNEQQIIQRPNNMKKITDVLTETRRRNITTEVSLIFGLPNQTVNSFIQSINYCKHLAVPVIYAFPLMLLRGTPLYEQKEKLGLIESDEIQLPSIAQHRIIQNIPHVISSPSFTFAEWLEMANIAATLDEYNARLVTPKISNTLKHTFWNTIRQEPCSVEISGTSPTPIPQK